MSLGLKITKMETGGSNESRGSNELEITAPDFRDNLSPVYLNLMEKCKSIDSRYFSVQVNNVKKYILDQQTPCTVKLFLGDWLYRRITMFMMSSPRLSTIQPILDQLKEAIRKETDIIYKGKYIHYHTRIACDTLCEHFYLNRFSAEYFLLQMINDVMLIRSVPPEKMLKHFLKWIRTSTTFEQQSNLLDVLLRHFKDDPEVKEVFCKMRKGDNKDKSGLVNLYVDGQNAHDDELNDLIFGICDKIMKWCDNNPYVGVSDDDTEYEFMVRKIRHFKNFDRLMTRYTVDNTNFNGKFNIKTFLIAFVRWTEQSEYRDEIYKIYQEELAVSYDLCSSRYIMAMVNSFQGIIPEFTYTVEFKTQLKNNLMTRVSKHFENASEDVISGTYDPKFKKHYLNFLCGCVNKELGFVIRLYGLADVEKNIVKAMEDIVSLDGGWKYENGMVKFQV